MQLGVAALCGEPVGHPNPWLRSCEELGHDGFAAALRDDVEHGGGAADTHCQFVLPLTRAEVPSLAHGQVSLCRLIRVVTACSDRKKRRLHNFGR